MPDITKRMKIMGGVALVLAVVLVVQYTWPRGEEPRETTPEPSPAPATSGNDAPTPAGPAAPAATPYRQVFKIAAQPRPEDLPVLKKEIKSPSWKNRQAAVIGIGRLKEEGDPASLQAMLANPQEKAEVRAAAAGQLGEMKHVAAGPALLDAMSDGSALVRAAAGVAITKIMGIHVGFSAQDTLAHRQEAIKRARDRWARFYEYHQKKHGSGI